MAGQGNDLKVTPSARPRPNPLWRSIPISGSPTSHQIVSGGQLRPGTLEVRADQALQVYSFTYG
ncbi:hypothetical protein [Mycobacterium seoulense]|uniref:hypothetical protein n=1 Tax=Mycobacterium seoulense TaxID=386911 RepID=UPI001E3DBDD5|nr:hypothetical protein [Mycobacterium seoulense]